LFRLIDELFAIDAEGARGESGPRPRATSCAAKKAPPLLEKIKAAVTAARATSLPASALAKAANYTLALWPKLTRFLEYPELELSNNLAEKLHAPGGARSQKLDPHRQRASRTQSRRHSSLSSKPADG